jgi:WD40 repeat protein
LESGEKANSLAGHTWEVIGVDYIEGGDRLVSMSMDGTLLYWNPSSAELEDQKYYPGMTSMVLAPEEELIAMGEWDGHVVMWDTANEIPYRSFNGSNDAVFLSEFSPDGRYLISGADGELKSALVWETATGEILQEFTGHTFDVRGVSISPDSAVLATGAWDGTILLWNLD